MLRATLSILGIYNFRPDIFDGFKVPDIVDKEALFPELLAQTSELESLYTDPDTLKTLVDVWSTRRLWSWDKLAATMELKYNPIWNVDGTETETITRNLTADGKEERNLANTTSSESTQTGTDLNSAFGYNSASAEPAEKTESEGKGTATGRGTDTGTVDTDRTETETIKTEKVRGGNIGVTMTQTMIEMERDVAKFDIYQYIIEDFKGRFCLLVY